MEERAVPGACEQLIFEILRQEKVFFEHGRGPRRPGAGKKLA